jgi:transposase
MARPSNYSPELRARAVRMVAELTLDYPSQYAAITAVAETPAAAATARMVAPT